MNFIVRFIFIALFLFASFRQNSHLHATNNDEYQHQLAICCIFQNDARFLKEWIEFHKLMGATHFILYNNNSRDNFQDVLRPYIETGEVELITWNKPTHYYYLWKRTQISAYNDAIQRAEKQKIKWLAIIDTDEFILPVIAPDLITFLHDFEEYGGVVANWQLFGTSDIQVIPSEKLMIEMLTKKAPDKDVENSYIKSIVRPERVKNIVDAHHAHYKVPFFPVGENKEPILGSMNSNILIDKVRINHYWTRDKKFLLEEKIPRRQKWQDASMVQLAKAANMNFMDNYTIFRFVEPLRILMGMDH